jgi:hypothetical protein
MEQKEMENLLFLLLNALVEMKHDVWKFVIAILELYL